MKYTYRTEYCLPLPIPLHLATNQEQVAECERKKEEMKAKGQPMLVSLKTVCEINCETKLRLRVFSGIPT